MLDDATDCKPDESRGAVRNPQGQRAPGGDRFSVESGAISDDGDGDELLDHRANRRDPRLGTSSEDYGNPDVDASPWAPLLGMLDSTEPEASPGDRPFAPQEGVEGAHALELRAESILQYAERGAERTGKLDCTEVGLSDDNRDVVAGRDDVEVAGMLREHTGHGVVHLADEVELDIGGSLRVHAHLEDNLIMAGVMKDEYEGGVFVTSAMSDDIVAGMGLRCTAPLDLLAHGLMAMEERPGTCMADGVLLDVAGTLYDREYGPSVFGTLVARNFGSTVATMKSGFFPLMKVALGVRHLTPGGGGGGGDANASPPAAPSATPAAAPPTGGAGGGAAAGSATLNAVESGRGLGRGAAGGSTDEIVSGIRTAERASNAVDAEDLRHPATTADNLDDLSRVDVEGEGYRQIGEIYGQSAPSGGWIETEDGHVYAIDDVSESLHAPRTADSPGAFRLADSNPGSAAPLSSEAANPGVHHVDGASASVTDAPTPSPSRRSRAKSTPSANTSIPDSVFVTPHPNPLDSTKPGTEGYDFGKSYGSLRDRLQHYRDFPNWRGNLAMEEALSTLDKKAVELFEGVGGSVDNLSVDPSTRTMAIHNKLQDMAAAAGNGSSLENIRGAIDELDRLAYDTVATMATRADEFTGAAIGSQRAPIDPGIDTDKLRSWLQEQTLQARAKAAEAANITNSDAAARAQTLAILEEQYYYQLTKSLDRGVSPLYVSNDLVGLTRADVDALYRRSAPNATVRRPMKADELNLLLKLQEQLVATLSDPDYIRRVDAIGASTPASNPPRRIQRALDFPETGSLRRAADRERPPPLPAPGSSNITGNVHDVRDRHFPRSALEASAGTLERRLLALSDQDAADLSRVASASTDSRPKGTAMPSPGTRPPPSDIARAPIVDERSGVWVADPPAVPEASPAPSSSTSASTQVDRAPSQASPVSWDSGLRKSDDSEFSPAARDADETRASDRFRAAPEHGKAGDMLHNRSASDYGLPGSPFDTGPRRGLPVAGRWRAEVGADVGAEIGAEIGRAAT